MANIIKCDTCGGILKSFLDDCKTCLDRENKISSKPEIELLFPAEKKIREKQENRHKKEGKK